MVIFLNRIKEYKETIFQNIKHTDENGNEYWEARELISVLEYSKWQKFKEVINKAMIACNNSNNITSDHFTQAGKMVNIGSKTTRKILDYRLSRYACYLIVQNCDPRKEVIALAQTYFAVQTRKQEILEKESDLLSEDEKRFYIRDLTKKGNYSLNQTARNSGVKNFDKFHNAGYRGLYGGETADDIAKRKNLRYREDILDNMSSTELAANLFRITQTDEKLKNENISGEDNANKTHYNVGKNVREAIIKNKGILPENMQVPKKSLKELERENKLNKNNLNYEYLKENDKIDVS